ncbi:MAG: PAS domain S-box protein, partial [Methanothrix sp.]|nr:PAS domain S-box protein [Methanothrix sp.]
SPDGKDFLIRDVNRAVETIENVRKSEILGRSVLEVFPGIREFGLFDVFLRVAKSGVAESFPVSLYKDSRISGWKENFVYRLPSGEIVAIYEDVTAKKQAEEALRESEERFRALLNGAGIGVGYWAPDGTLLFLNEISLKRLNGPAEDFIGKRMNDLFADSAEIYLDRLQKSIASEDPMEYEDYLHLPSGDGWYLSVYTRILGPDGVVRGVQVLSMDITERKNMELALQESELKFRTVADYTYDWEYWVLPDGTYQYVSPSCERITGYSADEFYHDPDLLTKIIHPDDREKVSSHTSHGLTDEDAEGSIEFRIIAKGGDTVWLGHICQPLYNSQGEFIGRRGSNRDVTKRRLAEESLRMSEIRFRALIQNSSDIIRILDRDGRILYESDSSERILGYPRGFLIGKVPIDYIHPDDRDRVKTDFLTVIDRNNTGTPTEFRIRKADGEYIWVDSIGTNLLDIPGVNGIVITTRPIQQRKEAEQALLESEQRLRLSLEGADAGFWDWYLPSGKTVFSDRYYTMLGYEPGEFPATYDAWINQMHPDDRKRVIPSLEQQIQKNQSQLEIEYRIRAKEGNWLWLLGRGKVVEKDGKGNPLRVTGVN